MVSRSWLIRRKKQHHWRDNIGIWKVETSKFIAKVTITPKEKESTTTPKNNWKRGKKKVNEVQAILNFKEH